MSSLAFDIFKRLLEQVDNVEAVAARTAAQGDLNAASILRRSAFVLAVAGIDTYFHEQATRLLHLTAVNSATDAARVGAFSGVPVGDLTGGNGEGILRLSLSYKTFVSPKAIDALLTAAGLDPKAIWQKVALLRSTRQDRLRLQLEFIYDRRNQIAHEGDWDFIQLDFRAMDKAHLQDCISHISAVAEAMDQIL